MLIFKLYVKFAVDVVLFSVCIFEKEAFYDRDYKLQMHSLEDREIKL